MPPRDLLEAEARAALARAVDEALPELDGRMRARRTPRPSLCPARLWRPALSLALIVIALGVGIWLGQRQPDLGPQWAQGLRQLVRVEARPDVSHALSLYRAAGLAAYEEDLPLGEPAQPEPPAGAAAESEGADESAETSSAFTAFRNDVRALDVSSAGPTMTLRLDGRAYEVPAPSNPASLGSLGEDLVLPVEDVVLRVSQSGKRAVLAGGLAQPAGVAVDPHGRVYVTERVAEGRLLRIASDGTVEPVKSQLSYPAGIAFDAQGALYLAESGRGQVLRLAPWGGWVTPESAVELVATGFGTHAAGPEQMGPYALAFDEAGDLWVSDWRAGKPVFYRVSDAPWWRRLW